MVRFSRVHLNFKRVKFCSDFPENNYERNFEKRATYEEDVTDLGHEMMGWPEVRIQKNEDEKICHG